MIQLSGSPGGKHLCAALDLVFTPRLPGLFCINVLKLEGAMEGRPLRAAVPLI